MRNALWYSVFGVMGFLVCWNARVAIAAEERQPQAAQHEQAVMPPLQSPDTAVKPPPIVRVLWPGDTVKAEIRCVVAIFRTAVLVWLVCNILLASWIFMDIRKLGQGHGIFVALALLAGFPAAILYAVVRIGDKKG